MALNNHAAWPGRVVLGVLWWEKEVGMKLEQFETIHEAETFAKEKAQSNIENSWAHVYEMKYINTYEAKRFVEVKLRHVTWK